MATADALTDYACSWEDTANDNAFSFSVLIDNLLTTQHLDLRCLSAPDWLRINFWGDLTDIDADYNKDDNPWLFYHLLN